MSIEASEIETGSVVGRYDGDDGEELAIAIRMPRSTWARITDAFLDGLLDDRDYHDDEERFSVQVSWFLSIQTADWEHITEPSSIEDDRWDETYDDEETPF